VFPKFTWAPGVGTVAASGSPTVRRRRLAAELRLLRERSKQLGDDVAQAVGWSPAKLSRYELGRTGLKPSEVERLLDFYEVVGPQRDQLLTLAYDATQRGWWEDYADVLSDEYLTFIGLEAEATSVSHWQLGVVPGLLQTEQYARQLLLGYQRVMPIPPGVIERRVKVRMIRQEALTRDPPLELTVVIDESVLMRRVGSKTVMHDQLLRLAQVMELPNVTLRILPLALEGALVAGSFLIFRFHRGTEEAMLHDVVSTENLKSDLYVEGEADTYEHRLAFEGLAAESLAPTQSRKLILRTVKRWL
jgi:transcriptional regulator with XRE-family HTH domain